MSYSLGVILLYSSDRSSDRHDAARHFLELCAARPEVLCLTWPTLMSYLRMRDPLPKRREDVVLQ